MALMNNERVPPQQRFLPSRQWSGCWPGARRTTSRPRSRSSRAAVASCYGHGRKSSRRP